MKNISQEHNCVSCTYNCLNHFLKSDDFIEIDKFQTILKYNPGDYIVRQGTFISEFIFLRLGIIKKVIEGKNDKNTLIKISEGVTPIGLSLFGNEEVYPFSVIALTKVEICMVRKTKLMEFVNGRVDAFKFITKQNSDEFLYLYHKLVVGTTRNSHGKLATAILYLTNGRFSTDVLNLLSRKDLADLAGISVESANKIILQLKNDGLIDIDKNTIIIKRPDLIEKLSTVG